MNSDTPQPNRSPPASTAAVLGARGRIGAAVAGAFLGSGWRVLAVVRPGADRGPLPSGVEVREADAEDPDALAAACRGADVIFNGLNPLYTDWGARNPRLAAAVLHAAHQCGATHLFPGNVYNYGPELPPVLAPDTPFAPDSVVKGHIRVEMERAFEEAASNRGVQTLILRAGDFYGSGEGSWMDLALLEKLGKGIFTYPGPMHVPHAWAYLPDLAQAFVRLAENRAHFGVFESRNFAGHTLSGSEMKAHVEAAVGRPLKARGVPWPFMRVMGWFSPMVREVSEMAYLWRRPHRLSDPLLEAKVKGLPSTPPREAVARAVRALHPKAVGAEAA